MKNLKNTGFGFMLILAVLLFACSGPGKKTQPEEVKKITLQPVAVNSEAQSLLDYLVEMGDYVNSRNFPSLIKASSVYEELDAKNLVVDLRDAETFSKGHIKGAVNVDFKNLPDFMSKKIKPFEYNRIVLVCNNGQVSSYATSLLRLMGYGNVFALRWGMSGWNKQFATDSWLKDVSSAYQDKLETTIHENNQLEDFPKMNAGKSTGEEIMAERVKALFEAGYQDAMISAEKVFSAPENYYIINYDRRDKYESGHIPGAIRYKPNGTLGIKSEMQTIPVEKDIVVYCGTGHNSGFATAYLRLFGYNAKTLTYGNNSFMHDKMVKEKESLSWLPFSEAEIEDYPFVKN